MATKSIDDVLISVFKTNNDAIKKPAWKINLNPFLIKNILSVSSLTFILTKTAKHKAKKQSEKNENKKIDNEIPPPY